MNNHNLQERQNFNRFKDWVFPRILCLSLPIICNGLLTIFLIVLFSDPECQITTQFNPIVITFLWTIISLEIIMILLYFICFFQPRILCEVYILHQKIEDAQIYITVVILLAVPIILVLARECTEFFQIKCIYLIMSSTNCILWIPNCFPRNTRYYFNGEYL